MKSRLGIVSTLLLTTLFLSFTNDDEIAECYISFKSPTSLTPADPDRLPESSRESRMIKTDKGEVEVTCTDGYRVLYNNDKGVPFVNLKVELSEKKAYEKDKKNLTDNQNI